MANSVGLHEADDLLRSETKDNHRALTSMMEELEAVDWYDQRVDAATDPELRALLAHNRDDEKEHAMMLLEWIRRSSGSSVAFARCWYQSIASSSSWSETSARWRSFVREESLLSSSWKPWEAEAMPRVGAQAPPRKEGPPGGRPGGA